MKKVVLLLMSVMTLIAFNSCNSNELTDADKDVTEQGAEIDPEHSTTVTVKQGYFAVLDNIEIYNAKDKLVGAGAYVGEYLVPFNGSIVISYHSEYDTSVCKSDRYKVGTAKNLTITINGHWSGSDIDYLYSEVSN